MQSPRGKGRMLSREGNKGRISASKQQEMSPRGRKLLGFKPKNMEDLKSVSPQSKSSHSPF